MNSPKSPMTFKRIPRQTDTQGACSIRYPFVELYNNVATEMAIGLLESVTADTSTEVDQNRLELAGLHADAFSLAEFISEPAPARRREISKISDLKSLADLAANLASEDGAWRYDAVSIQDLVSATVTEFCDRIQQFIDSESNGLSASQLASAMKHIISTMEEESRVLKRRATPWTQQQSLELREAEQKLKRWTVGRSLQQKLAVRLFPNGPSRLLLAESHKRELTRIVRTIADYQAQREMAEMIRVRTMVFERLLDESSHVGSLQSFLDRIDENQQPLDSACTLLERGITSIVSGRADEVLLVDSLDTIVDFEHGTTVRDVFEQRLDLAGFSKTEWAAEISQQGIAFGNRTLRPSLWGTRSPAEIAGAMLQHVQKLLGSDDWDRRMNTESPQSPVEHLASITMLDDVFSNLLDRMVPIWIRRSLPYATFDHLSGWSANPGAFLFCTEKLRSHWIRCLANRVQLIEERRSETYQCYNPNVATLFHVIQGAPAGAMRELKRWSAQGNINRREKITEPLQDRRSYSEIRLLQERVRDNSDCVALFNAGLKCSSIVSLGEAADRFVLNRNEPRLTAVFHDMRLIRNWREPEYFHGLAKRGGLLTRLFGSQRSTIPDLFIALQRLTTDSDPSVVCRRLEEIGILEEQSGQFRLSQVPTCHLSEIPSGLCQIVSGGLKGLTEQEFISALMSRDRLYNVVFWSTLDAWQEGVLEITDVPDSVAEVAQELM